MSRIGFYQSTGRDRSCITSRSGRKLGYIENRSDGTWLTRLDGTLVARVVRFREECKAVDTDCSSCTVIEADDLEEC